MANLTPTQTGQTSRGMSILALVTGLGSIACVILHIVTEIGWPVFSGTIVLGALGIIFGIIALRKRQPKGMAVTGLVTGIVGFLFGVGLLAFALLFIGAFMA